MGFRTLDPTQLLSFNTKRKRQSGKHVPKSLLSPKKSKCILPVTGSDALSIQLLVNNAIAHGKDTTGEMQKASLRDTTLAEQVKIYHSRH